MHYYSGPQLVEIFARKRRHKLRNMAHLAAQKRNARKEAGRDGGRRGWPLAGFNVKQDKGDSKC